MTLQLKPGHDLSDEELFELEALIQQQYPDEDVVIVYEDAPQAGYQPAAQTDTDKPPNIFSRLIVAGVTVVAALYLVNPTAGVIELIPDVVPVVGNLDEGAAVMLLISGLNFFGVNIGWLQHVFGQGMGKRKREE